MTSVHLVTVSKWAKDFGISSDLANELVRLEVIKQGKGLVMNRGRPMINPKQLAQAFPLHRKVKKGKR